jgi:hypothetical protein
MAWRTLRTPTLSGTGAAAEDLSFAFCAQANAAAKRSSVATALILTMERSFDFILSPYRIMA